MINTMFCNVIYQIMLTNTVVFTSSNYDQYTNLYIFYLSLVHPILIIHVSPWECANILIIQEFRRLYL